MRKLNRQSMCHTINVKMINCVKCKLDSEEDIVMKFVGSFLSPIDRSIFMVLSLNIDVAGHSIFLQSAIMAWVYKPVRAM